MMVRRNFQTIWVQLQVKCLTILPNDNCTQVLNNYNKNLFKFEPFKDLLDFYEERQKIFTVNICFNEFLQRCKYIPVIQFVYEKEDKLMI